MDRLVKILARKQWQRPLYIALCISMVLLLTITFFAPSVIAWFKSFIVVKNDGQLTNYTIKTEYSLDGSSWSTYTAGTPIAVSSADASKLQIRVSYTGIHKAYLRVKLHGDYVNRHSGTHLSVIDGTSLFSPSGGSGWKLSNGYYYYTSKVGKSNVDGSKSASTQVLSAFKVVSSLPSDASAYQEYDTELYVMVDAVQTDRYDELWGLSSLPF